MICAVLVLVLIPREAVGAWNPFSGLSGFGLIAGIFHAVTTLISLIGGLLITLAGYLVTWMLGLNGQILDSSNVLMYTGWRIARDFANLGFVLLTVIIAFATILRYKEYGYQKLLFNLIKAAILVNFSLAIAGVFIDFSDLATNFFKSRIGGGQDMAKIIAGAFAPQRLYMENDVANSTEARPPDDVGGATKATVAIISSIAEMVFVIAFSLITAITMLGLAFMLMLRFVWLSFLLMVSPLVYLAWVMPGMQKHWKSWWDKFFQWVFFGPAVLFFVYVALLSAEKLGAAPAEIGSGGYFTSSLNGIMTQGAQMIILSAVMLGGLMAAQKMGIAGADAALKAAKGVGDGTKKWAGNKAMRGGEYLQRKTSRLGDLVSADKGLGKVGGAMQNWSGKSRRWFNPLRLVAGAAGSAGKNMKNAGEKIHMTALADRSLKPLDTKPVSLIGSMLEGTKKSSGLFKGKHKENKWRCTQCNNIVSAAQKPGWDCEKKTITPPHTTPTVWVEVPQENKP